MPNPVGSLAQAGANTEFLAVAEQLFSRPATGVFAQFCEMMPMAGTALELDALGATEEVAELLGSRVFSNIRAYTKSITAKPYSVGMVLPKLTVENDKTGMVSKKLNDFLSANQNFWDKPATDMLISNPTGIDGVAILSNSHPHGASGGTWDNLGGGAISASELRAAWDAMTSLQNEKGAPMGIRPTHLMVGPAYEQEALDLVGANRAVPYSNAGVPDAASNVVAAVMQENWLRGRLQVIVNPRLVGSGVSASWFLMDKSRPGLAPIAIGEAIKPTAAIVNGAGDEPVLNRSEYAYYVEGYAAMGGYIPHTVFGYIG